MSEVQRFNTGGVGAEPSAVDQLKAAFPAAVTEGKIDFDRLRQLLGDAVDIGPERYLFTWPGKADAIRAAQVPSVGTLVPEKGKSIDWDKTQNLFIEGDNLEVLKLLQKSYAGKVKMIYIDPPYNTGREFIYPDKFGESLQTYLQYTGQVDAEGRKFSTNTESDGRYHSKWLNMMYSRLLLARNLLQNDGIIFISIDDNEIGNLRRICDEIFGPDNLVQEMIWKNKYGPGAMTKGVGSIHEYILVYSKTETESIEAPLSADDIAKYKETDEKVKVRGPFITQPLATKSKDDRANLVYPIPYKGKEIWPDKQWIWSKDRLMDAVAKNEVVINETDGKYSVRFKQYLRDESGKLRKGKPISILVGPYNQDGTEEVNSLLGEGIFNFPKPTALIERLFSFVINGDESSTGVFLDFFSGSASSAHAVMKMNASDNGNRRFIQVQLPEPTSEESEAYKAGYKNIAELGEARIKLAGKKIREDFADKIATRTTPLDIGFKVLRLVESTFMPWDSSPEGDVQKRIELAVSPIRPGAKDEDVLTEILLKSGFELTVPVIMQKVAGIETYSVQDGGLLITLKEKLTLDFIREVAKIAPGRFVALEKGFGSDDLLTNAAQLLKEANVEFRVI